MTNLSTDFIKETFDAQTTFDGKLLPDMAESYKLKTLVDELLRRSAEWETQKYCKCSE